MVFFCGEISPIEKKLRAGCAQIGMEKCRKAGLQYERILANIIKIGLIEEYIF